MSRKTILKKTAQIGISTLLSRVFGIVRELLMVRYLGASSVSDVFLTAYRIPNSLRKIFAEGALSAAFVPTAIAAMHQKKTHSIAGLMTLCFFFFEGILACVCTLVMIFAHHVLHFIAPGFSPEQIALAVPLVRILMPFIMFISSSALLAGALHTVNHFFIPACAPIIINTVFITGLAVCLAYELPVQVLCWFIILGGVAHFLAHLIMYKKYNLHFSAPTNNDYSHFKNIVKTFLLCLPSASLTEIALFIDTSFASFLPAGSLSLISYANRFVGIPLGVFSVAFSTVLLPHFSRITAHRPQRLPFYFLESAKLILWVTAPTSLLMIFFSHDIFSTLFLSSKFTLQQVNQAALLLSAFCCGLFFISLNKIILTIVYALHAAWLSSLVALATVSINVLLNILLITHFQSLGIACATTIAYICQTILLLTILTKKYNFRLYYGPFFSYTLRYLVQLFCMSLFFYYTYNAILIVMSTILSPTYAPFFITKIGLWLWVGPLALMCMFFLWKTRSLFKIRLYFLS